MKRHGFTLVELTTVMATTAIVMGITVVLLVQLFDFQQNNNEYAERTRTVDRLAADFREDVRTYGKPEIPSDGNTLIRWTTEAVTIDYTTQAGEFPGQLNVIRTMYKDGQKDRYETYRLPDRTALCFADGKNDDAGLVALSLWTVPQGTTMPNLDEPNLGELNPFDRTLPKSLEQRMSPKYAGHWHTIIARYQH